MFVSVSLRQLARGWRDGGNIRTYYTDSRVQNLLWCQNLWFGWSRWAKISTYSITAGSTAAASPQMALPVPQKHQLAKGYQNQRGRFRFLERSPKVNLYSDRASKHFPPRLCSLACWLQTFLCESGRVTKPGAYFFRLWHSSFIWEEKVSGQNWEGAARVLQRRQSCPWGWRRSGQFPLVSIIFT